MLPSKVLNILPRVISRIQSTLFSQPSDWRKSVHSFGWMCWHIMLCVFGIYHCIRRVNQWAQPFSCTVAAGEMKGSIVNNPVMTIRDKLPRDAITYTHTHKHFWCHTVPFWSHICLPSHLFFNISGTFQTKQSSVFHPYMDGVFF